MFRSEPEYRNDREVGQPPPLQAPGPDALDGNEQRPARLAQSKRERMKELVKRLGEHATPSMIREEAYKTGFGPVHSKMLISVRNELWPNRKKHPGGYRHNRKTTTLFVPTTALGAPCCPVCGSQDVRVRETCRVPDGNVRRGRICQSCGHWFYSLEMDSDRRIHARRRLAMVATEKECSKCKRILPVAAFSKKANDAHLYRSSCRECLNRQRAVRYMTTLLKGHGLTDAEYRSMLEAQGGRCVICRSKCRASSGKARTSYRFLRIDHSHRSGAVRGLLCDKCNLGIGNFDDDPMRLERAAAYLKRHDDNIVDYTI
ncbi:MAG: endonuclease domain-containing protein [Gemmataceae bacterium]